MSKSKNSVSRKKKNKSKRIIKQLLILLVLILVLGYGYYYIKYKMVDKNEGQHVLYNTATDYYEVESNDTVKYLTTVVYKNNINIYSISNTFYKNNVFWPYIYIANKDIIENPLNIPKEVPIKVPRMNKTLLDPQNATSINRAKLLADSILENTNTDIIPPLK